MKGVRGPVNRARHQNDQFRTLPSLSDPVTMVEPFPGGGSEGASVLPTHIQMLRFGIPYGVSRRSPNRNDSLRVGIRFRPTVGKGPGNTLLFRSVS